LRKGRKDIWLFTPGNLLVIPGPAETIFTPRGSVDPGKISLIMAAVFNELQKNNAEK
jgi:hypothetical protein